MQLVPQISAGVKTTMRFLCSGFLMDTELFPGSFSIGLVAHAKIVDVKADDDAKLHL